jgi:S1-C subfamily serine protease
LANSITSGIVSAIRDDGDLIQFSAPITGGNSGSPLINAWGDVIGVVKSSIESAQNIIFAVSIRYVIKLMNSQAARAKIPPPAPQMDIEIPFTTRPPEMVTPTPFPGTNWSPK